jgi:hypothetical protein
LANKHILAKHTNFFANFSTASLFSIQQFIEKSLRPIPTGLQKRFATNRFWPLRNVTKVFFLSIQPLLSFKTKLCNLMIPVDFEIAS